MNSRTMELRALDAQGIDARRNRSVEATLLTPFGNRTSADAYCAEEEEGEALGALVHRVAQAAGVDVRCMPAPYVMVTSVEEGGADWMCRMRSSRAAEVVVSVSDGTASIEFPQQLATPREQDAGEALIYDPSKRHRIPSGDWRRTLCFDLPPKT